MRAPKKPPPDTEGNLRGRIRAVKTLARQCARTDEGDYERALGRHLKAAEPQLKALRARLAAVRGGAPSSPAATRAKSREAGARTADQADILETLGIAVG